MIKISIQNYKNADLSLASYYTKMTEEEDNMTNAINLMDPHWTGIPKTNFVNYFDEQFCQNGDYYDTMTLVKKSHDILTNHYSELVEISYRIENMGDHLTRDGYTQLNQSIDFSNCSPTAYNSGKVYFDNGGISIFNSNVTDSISYAISAKKSYDEAISMVSGIINLSDASNGINSGLVMIKRLNSFKLEMGKISGVADTFVQGFNADCNNLVGLYGGPIDSLAIDYAEEARKMEDLLKELEEKGLTLEEYRSAVLDSFMYLDFFNDYSKDGISYDSSEAYVAIKNAKTLNDIISELEKYDVYTNENSTRFIYLQIVKDAIEKDPALGRLSVEYMSRTMEDKNYNVGTNGIVFQDLSTDTVYVAFRGTSTGEWLDDGERFSVLSMDDMTIQMKQTIDFFETVGKEMGWNEDTNLIVTGHSQGGNDSQVVTLMTDMGHYVKKNFSFDGEGHSKELLEDVKRYLGEEEYQSRINKMYSICGEYDFVNHLGEKVIKEENTKYVHCDIDGFARCHDIVSMFCTKVDGEYHYSGTINTAVGTSSSFVTELTATLWEELKELPYVQRKACQDALMNALEAGFSGFEQTQGLNGEKAELYDYYIFITEGLDAIGKACVETGYHEVNDLLMDKIVDSSIDYLNEKNFINSKQAQDLTTLMNNAFERNEKMLSLGMDISDYVSGWTNSYGKLISEGADIAKFFEVWREKGEMPKIETQGFLLAEQVVDMMVYEANYQVEKNAAILDFSVEAAKNLADYTSKLGHKLAISLSDTYEALKESTIRGIEIKTQQQQIIINTLINH